MGHNASKVLMGQTNSNVKEVSNHVGSIAAGLVVHLKSDDTITLAKADGGYLGVSLGKDLSNAGFTAIARKGLGVPVKLAAGFTTPAKGGQVAINDTTGEARAYTGTGDSYVNAYYVSGLLTGILEDGTEANVALVDFPGGL
jgi:hypothetical protein